MGVLAPAALACVLLASESGRSRVESSSTTAPQPAERDRETPVPRKWSLRYQDRGREFGSYAFHFDQDGQAKVTWRQSTRTETLFDGQITREQAASVFRAARVALGGWNLSSGGAMDGSDLKLSLVTTGGQILAEGDGVEDVGVGFQEFLASMNRVLPWKAQKWAAPGRPRPEGVPREWSLSFDASAPGASYSLRLDQHGKTAITTGSWLSRRTLFKGDVTPEQAEQIFRAVRTAIRGLSFREHYGGERKLRVSMSVVRQGRSKLDALVVPPSLKEAGTGFMDFLDAINEAVPAKAGAPLGDTFRNPHWDE